MTSSYSTTHYEDLAETPGPLPHPYLREPKLYISGLAPNVRKEDLAEAFRFCVPYRPVLPQDESGRTLSGHIDFKDISAAEKALATLQNRPLPPPAPTCNIILSPFPPTSPPTSLPPPSAAPRLIRQLPFGISDSQLYDLFRPFGPLANVRSEAGFGPDVGIVEFWREEDAHRAESVMHGAGVGDGTITMEVYQPRRLGQTDISPSAPPFVPAHQQQAQHQNQHQSAYPQNGSPSYGGSSPPGRSPILGAGAFLPGPGQQVQYGSNSHSGLIDPCNLFIKNLDLSIDSNDLFTSFRPYGQIVSARVMRSETGQSRGFGFVSFQTPDQAAHALNSMNGAVLGSKVVAVRLHEPKQLRQEKLASRYRPPHPRSGSGATSPTPSEVADFNSPLDRNRRSSGSYFQAALMGTLNLPMRFEELNSLTPVVRKEVLTGELTRRLRNLSSVQPGEIDSLAASLSAMSLPEVIEGIHSQDVLAEQVRKIKSPPTPDATPQQPNSMAPSSSTESPKYATLGVSLASTPVLPQSVPEHPSTPVSGVDSLIEPPRTSSPAGSIAVGSEKDKLLASVTRIHPANATEIIELMLSLPKKERALCLFNPEYLRNKVNEAVAVLEADDKGAKEGSVAELPAPAALPAIPTTTNGNGAGPAPPQTPDLSSGGPSAVASPAALGTPSLPVATVHTLASLAKLPATEIISLASSQNATGLPLPKADPEVFKGTDQFIDGLEGQSEGQKKQVVGQKLFKVVKGFGVRNPKVTIHLVDTEDLRALAHLMNSYPSVLKEKVLQATAAATTPK